MTVEELIRELEKCDKKSKVGISVDVSTCEENAFWRIFCDAREVMHVAGHTSLLCDNAYPNWIHD